MYRHEEHRSAIKGFFVGFSLMLFIVFLGWHNPGPTMVSWCEVLLEKSDGDR